MTSTAASKPRKAVDPDRLRKLMDGPSIANASREVPSAIVKNSTLVTSWNREHCDVRPFEKLAPPANVILTKDLRALHIDPSAAPRSGLQLRDVVVLPRSAPETDVLTAPVMIHKESFAHAATIEHQPVPGSVLLQEGLMAPQQRRERLHFEAEHHRAKRAIHEADMNERRLHQIMKERHSTCDVLGTSGTRPAASRVRGDPYKTDFLSHDNTQRGNLPREYQSKCGDNNPRVNHHARIFNETPLERNEQRAQLLRNEGSAGRPIDIVNGGRVTYYPPTIPEKQHPRQAHPSVIVHPYTR